MRVFLIVVIIRKVRNYTLNALIVEVNIEQLFLSFVMFARREYILCFIIFFPYKIIEKFSRV